jgi:hypothetical protein
MICGWRRHHLSSAMQEMQEDDYKARYELQASAAVGGRRSSMDAHYRP